MASQFLSSQTPKGHPDVLVIQHSDFMSTQVGNLKAVSDTISRVSRSEKDVESMRRRAQSRILPLLDRRPCPIRDIGDIRIEMVHGVDVLSQVEESL